jgi:phosphatidylglycerophosphate synthase
MINFKKHIVNQSIKDNIIQFLLYRSAFVVVHIFKFFKISPNQISFTSFILCIISCYFLYQNQITLFLILWYISHFLDYCDGTLARLTGNTTKILLRLDHFLDLIRIILTFLFIAIYFKSDDIWILTFIFISSIFISQILNLEYDSKMKINAKFKNKTLVNKNNIIIRHLYNVFFTLNGHTLFLIGFIFININFAMLILCYLILLNVKNMFGPLNYLIRNKRYE